MILILLLLQLLLLLTFLVTVHNFLEWQTKTSGLTRTRSCDHHVRAQHSNPLSKVNFVVGFGLLLPKYNVSLDSTKSEDSAAPLWDLILHTTRFVRPEGRTVKKRGFQFFPYFLVYHRFRVLWCGVYTIARLTRHTVRAGSLSKLLKWWGMVNSAWFTRDMW